MHFNVPQTPMDEENDIYLLQDDIDEEIEIIGDEEFAENDTNEGDNDDDARNDASQPALNDTNRDDSSLIFKHHEKAVICCSVNSLGTIAVSGDQNDTAYVWDISDGSVLFECTGHKDSVICAGFSQKDSFISTGDMNGLIQIWKCNGEKCGEYEVDDLNWIQWHPIVDDVLLAGTSSGIAWMWKVTDPMSCKTFQGFGSSNTVGKCLSDGKRIVMGYDDGAVRIWDMKGSNVLFAISDYNSHKESVTSIDCNSDGLIITGSIDSTAKLINSQTGKVIATFECGTGISEESDDNDSVESVGFCHNLSIFATGTINGSIDIWDVSNHSKRHSCQQSSGVSKLLWSVSNPHLLFTAGLDGVLRIYDGRSGQIQDVKHGHTDHILDLFLSNCANLIVTSSEDSTCRVFYI